MPYSSSPGPVSPPFFFPFSSLFTSFSVPTSRSFWFAVVGIAGYDGFSDLTAWWSNFLSDQARSSSRCWMVLGCCLTAKWGRGGRHLGFGSRPTAIVFGDGFSGSGLVVGWWPVVEWVVWGSVLFSFAGGGGFGSKASCRLREVAVWGVDSYVEWWMQRRGFSWWRVLGCEGDWGQRQAAKGGRLTAAGGGMDARLAAVFVVAAFRSFLGPTTYGGSTAILLRGDCGLAFRIPDLGFGCSLGCILG